MGGEEAGAAEANVSSLEEAHCGGIERTSLSDKRMVRQGSGGT